MASLDLTELRDTLSADLHQIESGGCASDEFVEKFMLKHRHLVERASTGLLKIALIKILNDVKNRKTPISSVRGQGNLFYDYDGPRFFTIKEEAKSRSKNVRLDKMKCSQLQDWCESHEKERKKEDLRVKHARMLLSRVEGHWSENTTVREALLAARKAAQKGEGKREA